MDTPLISQGHYKRNIGIFVAIHGSFICLLLLWNLNALIDCAGCNEFAIADIKNIGQIDYANCNITIDYVIKNQTYTNKTIILPCAPTTTYNKLHICAPHYVPDKPQTYDLTTKPRTFDTAISIVINTTFLLILVSVSLRLTLFWGCLRASASPFPAL